MKKDYISLKEQFIAWPRCVLVTEGKHRIVILSEDEPAGFFYLPSTERVRKY
ncbi:MULTISPECIES: hypothetical protein [Cytobacillus]|uniref:hypothetical protein n=1 Tax=Cytobacillus TaxID=2675230 RepID=UPI0012F9DBC4|nr:hypothetical protein [Cytobacillus sp. Bac17]